MEEEHGNRRVFDTGRHIMRIGPDFAVFREDQGFLRERLSLQKYIGRGTRRKVRKQYEQIY
ncbi:MAG: hypothetical protein K1W26_12620 [Acetatifactor sp.]